MRKENVKMIRMDGEKINKRIVSERQKFQHYLFINDSGKKWLQVQHVQVYVWCKSSIYDREMKRYLQDAMSDMHMHSYRLVVCDSVTSEAPWGQNKCGNKGVGMRKLVVASRWCI